MESAYIQITANRRIQAVCGVSFWIAIILSLLIYYVLFSRVLHKPQTIGQHQKLIVAKTAILDGLKEETKLVVLAGSNGRVSHSARLIGEIIDLPAVNMSVTASMSMDFQLNRIKPFLSAGDIVYMPLEYGQLDRSRKTVYSGVEAPYVVAYEKASLADFNLMRQLHAYFYFDLQFIFSALAEMALTEMGYERRVTADDFNDWGDQTGHSIEKAQPYVDYITRTSVSAPKGVDTKSFSAQSVADFFEWAREHNVVVVGGYPAYAEGPSITNEVDAGLKGFYQSRGHYFLSLESKGRYPKKNFFDTIYHLAEPYQLEHSQLVGEELKKLLGR